MAASISAGPSRPSRRPGRNEAAPPRPQRTRQGALTGSPKRRKEPRYFRPGSMGGGAATQFYTGWERRSPPPSTRVPPSLCYRRFTLDKKKIQRFQYIDNFAQILSKELKPQI